ncbi:cobalamin biosynthesis protein CobD/CbiB [Colwellia psychrerythraea]|uniref:Cobalamin biosynthesis protein CobD n=1 Tax=Colwellia psychrerythraea TaxID=28229 RepID=A0A099KA36_COLPS|nr:CobD/CbiB family cobalamin biosynthesis protein [Colwellia psychrerythraea]KGJ87201.1 Cobalamin biosynthesis protein cbiB [Colwellia psychrerythraea]
MSEIITNIYQQTIILLPDFSVFITVFLALLLDKYLGEAKRFHYLVGFGCLAKKLETKLNTAWQASKKNNNEALQDNVICQKNRVKIKLLGTLAWCLLVLPLPLIYFYQFNHLTWYWQILLDATIIYLAIGLNSLHQHAMQVYQPLNAKDLTTARYFTGYLVSRDTTKLSEQEMSRATIESMLENGHDSIIASLFYYLIGGAPLVMIHRLANTLDAMWGYKNSRFNDFGYASARLDDVLGFLSGKCCTLLYALQGLKTASTIKAMTNAYKQGNQYKSHNGGWVMAAGATVMNRQLGGSALYHGKTINSVTLGFGNSVTSKDIPTSLLVVTRASLFLLVLIFIFQLIHYLLQ